MINTAHFDFGLRSARNLDKMKNNTDILTTQLNKIAKDTIVIRN